MKEEKNLNNLIGKDNPFKVPENYFQDFSSQLMNKLPELEVSNESNKEISLWERVKPWIYMTAMFCGLMFGIEVMMGDKANSNPESNTESLFSSHEEVSDFTLPDEYIDPIVDQTMLDDYTLYMYLSNADSDFYE